MIDDVKRSGGGVVILESMLSGYVWNVWSDDVQDDAFKSFGNGGEQRDGPERGSNVRIFIRFANGDDVGSFPDVWDRVGVHGGVVDAGEVGDGFGSKMLEVANVYVIWSNGVVVV